MKLWRMERLILLGMTVLGGLVGTVCAANPTERRWNVAEGFVNAAASWQNGTPPAQGTPDAAGEMAYFTGAGDKTVRFPAGGWTDEEVTVAAQYGVLPVTLGPHILRAETACIAACAKLL